MHIPVHENKRYIDNTWSPEGRFGGTVIDCYNDSGDIAGGGTPSMFELEGVSPAGDLGLGESIEFSVTVHFYQLADIKNMDLLFLIFHDLTGIDLHEEKFED